MKSIGKRLILISFIFALLASATVFVYLQSLKEPQDEIEKITVLVASETIPPRTIIEKNMIEEIEVTESSIFANFINKPSDILGKYTKETIFQNEGFIKNKLINEVEEELSIRIEGNHRAISINVSGGSGVSDLIKCGDFVDIIVYLSEKKEGQRIVRPDLSKMILQNIEVLAIDKNVYRDGEERIEVPTNYLVTLSVPIFEIEKLVLAEDIGQIKLALRPLNNEYIYPTEGIVWQELLLDDFYKMKDMFPTYDIKQSPGTTVNQEEYEYEKYIYYTVQYGDTLKKISRAFYGKEDNYLLIKQINKLEDENLIMAGTGIKIPILEE